MSSDSDLPTEILNITERMLKAAAEGEWELVMQLERTRAESIQMGTLSNIQGDQPPSSVLATILSLNEKIVMLSQTERERLAGEIRTLNMGQQANRAYRKL